MRQTCGQLGGKLPRADEFDLARQFAPYMGIVGRKWVCGEVLQRVVIDQDTVARLCPEDGQQSPFGLQPAGYGRGVIIWIIGSKRLVV